MIHEPSFRDRVAKHFRAHPDVWIDGTDLERIGGRYAWRTRLSECRRQLGMTIENRQRWMLKGSAYGHTQPGRYRLSEYRFRPNAPRAQVEPDPDEYRLTTP